MRKTVSVLMLYAMIVMTYTGIMLFIVPQGKVAYWVNWSMFGMTKTQFSDMHVTFMILFVITSIIHIFYNFKPLVSYFKDKAKSISFFTKYNLISLAITLFFIVGTLFVTQPFKTVLEFQSSIKDYWADELGRPPFGHAELSPLKGFCRKLGYDIKEVMLILKEEGIIVKNQKETLNSIAKNNNTTPAKIYDIIFEELE